MTKPVRRSFQAITGISLAGFIALIAVNGRAFFDAFAGLPVVLQKFAEVLPLGTSTFFAVLVIAGFAWYWTRRLQPTHEFWPDAASLVVGLTLMIALNFTTTVPPGQGRAQVLLQAIMLGLLAGFSAPFVFKGLAALWRYVSDFVCGDVPE